MTRTTVRRTFAATALLPLLALAACGGSDGDSDQASEGGSKATRACVDLPTADPAATLPEDFPTFDDVVLYEPSTQGQTKVVFGLLEEADFLEVRDEQVDKLTEAGYTIEGKDQESVEAEAEFTGPHEGTIKVQPQCEGYVTIRYKING